MFLASDAFLETFICVSMPFSCLMKRELYDGSLCIGVSGWGCMRIDRLCFGKWKGEETRREEKVGEAMRWYSGGYISYHVWMRDRRIETFRKDLCSDIYVCVQLCHFVVGPYFE